MTVDIPADLLERSEAEEMYDYAAAVPAPSREALGMASLRIGGGVALAMRDSPNSYWNKALGLGFDEPITAGLIAEVLEFYRAQGAPQAVLPIAPSVLPEDWPDICAKFGLEPAGKVLKHACSIESARSRVETVRLDEGLTVEPVRREEAAYWAAVVVRGMGMHERGFLEMAAGTVGRRDWYTFTVREGDQLLAGASLHVHEDVASFFADATLPQARGRGGQSALLATRIGVAAALGCRWLVVETAGESPEGNSSLHNMLRFGFETMYERQQWTWQPEANS